MNRQPNDGKDSQHTAEPRKWPRVLFVGYNFPLARFEQYLKGRDATFITQQNGADPALEYLREIQFAVDWIVIDLELKGTKNGLHLTVEIRTEEAEYQHKNRIIWATSVANAEHGPIGEAAKRLDVDRIIAKPYDAIMLFEQLQKEQ